MEGTSAPESDLSAFPRTGPTAGLLHQGFEARADLAPLATAVVAGDRRLSYAELEARANRLARHLRSLGVGPEVRVGLCLERSEQLLVGILGVLKAGGAYVPLDPAYPAERLAFLLEDSRAPVVLTRASLLPVLPEHEARLVLVDRHAGEIAACSPDRPEPSALQPSTLPQNLAYFIYTSGSTGRAKGVAITHHSAGELVRWASRVYPREDLAGVLFATSICFDLSIFEIFVPLTLGGAVIVAGNALELPDLPAAGEVTLVNTVPSAMTELVRQGAVPPWVRVVNLAGEALPGALVAAIYGTTSARRVYNLYGPSEDTTYSTWALIPEDASIEPPIGRPVDGTRAWLLDEQGRPVPAGEVGEIFLGGEGLARGYFDRPDLTADRFVPDPFPGVPGARLYRTGDLARELPGGDLHYLGRVDHQVKIRGFRVELGEIEAGLLRHPAVREAVVGARGDVADRRLVAWFAAGPPAPTARELREHLQKFLPEFMVPSAFVRLDELPRTPNGKVDRKSLPEPGTVEAGAVDAGTVDAGTVDDGSFVAPRIEVEEELCRIWGDVLGLERVGVHDSFFEVGGHSLLGGRVLARVRDLFGVDLPLSVLMAGSTVAALAQSVESARRSSPLSGARPVPVPRNGLLPLSPTQRGLWFLDRMAPGLAVYNIATGAALSGPLDRAALAAALGAVVRRHEPLRTRFPETGGEPWQEILPPASFVLPVIDLSALPPEAREAELEGRGLEQARGAFDLARELLLRACLVCLAPREHVLLVTVHHIVFDGWSEGVFWSDLSAFYAGGGSAPLPELRVQHADHVVWQLGRFEERGAAQVAWWRHRLDGVAQLELPTDRPRPAARTWRGDVRTWSLPSPLASVLRAFARQQGATPFTALLAGLSALLSRYSHQDRFAVGAPVAGRTLSELEGLIGLYTNVLALHADLSGRPSFLDLVERTRETLLSAMDHQELPFDRLVQELNPGRDPSRNPIFPVLFQVVDRARPLPALPGIAASPAGFHTGAAKLDLEVEVEDRGGDSPMTGRCDFDVDLFDAPTVERLLRHFNELLAAALAQPERPLDELSFLSEAESRQLLEWSAAGLDRKALPAPRYEAPAGGVAPRTPVEERLAAFWRDVLKVEEVSVHDNFFEMGGHSLLASQLLARLRQGFGVEVALRSLFQRPTLAELAAEVEEILAHASAKAASPIRRIPRDGELPLSYSQLRQWFLVQLEPGTSEYNLTLALRLRGELDRGALQHALDEIVRRHEALRTVFAVAGGRPVPVIREPGAVRVREIDLSGDAGEREAAVREQVQSESKHVFDLTLGPLFRLALAHLGPGEHYLLLTVHHIVFDGWSYGVFIRELTELYRAFAEGRPSPLPELEIQYVDHAAWQRGWIESPEAAPLLDYWRDQLAGSAQVLELPLDRPRPVLQTFAGAYEHFSLPPGTAAPIRALGLGERATLFMTLLAAFGALLHRYTGQDDINVGTYVANRRWEQIEKLLGFFVNTLVLRTDLSGGPSFRELLARVRHTTLGAYDHQDLPFEKLLDELGTERDLSRGPLFQVLFGLANFSTPTVRLPGLEVAPIDLHESDRANMDLMLWMWEEEGAIGGWLQYNTALFEPDTARRMVRHFKALLAGAAEDPRRPLADLPLLSAEETEQILIGWNRPGERSTGDSEPDALVHERFERWAEVRPDAIALETADRREILTYAELNLRGNRLAHCLRRLGVRTDSIVGIWAERSVEFIVGVLGVLKAGGAYLPLDPALPADRLAAILRGSGASVLLARDGRPAGLPPFEGEVVTLRGLKPSAPGDDRNPEPWAVPESLAYAIFTSGSTGVPKGALIPHSALANFAETTRRLYGVGPEDRVLQFSSLVFDVSVEEIFTSWTAGAALVLRDEEMISSPARFLRACDELDVQMVDLPTAYWHELGVELAKGEVPLPSCVRSVVFAGERALQERLAGWQEAMRRGVRLFNSYGPAEATPANSVYDPSEPVVGMSTNGLPIGRPMRGARLYVVGPDLRPVPVGVAGELLIAGAGLGRGYAGRPDLTAESFVPDPFSTVPGERVYRPGDRVRWIRDGNLEFLGRVDDQVKIRGFRVEPGEVAAVICRHPGVRQAVVVPRDGGPVGLRLVAYAACGGDTAVDAGVTPAVMATELRDLVKSALPAYMVPADFVLLDALPLTATGKLDRRALPEPASGGDDEGYAPPETATEELLAGIWAELLGRERVGIFDNFFDLGGHSLLAPQVFARIEESFQLELPLRALFEAPTVAQLANLIEQELLAQIEELSDEEAENLVLSE
jgi:amino acid adenylation domain-containing protein